ncbi:MAG: dTDP-4-dehydrorhamnose 3,5-epimerase [Cupriavidus sp.]|nr:dTDP-4-dehydrorhamnose 3,5-epimerase [Cupriavidus sp.]
MQAIATVLPEVLILEPQVHADQRGFFYESFNEKDFEAATGLRRSFVQDNHSHSVKNVLRGLHYQVDRPQGKLVRVVSGEVFDVAVDVRAGSPNYGKWVGVVLSVLNKRQLWVPEGFAHGFLVLSAHADVLYKTTDYYHPGSERALAWNDPALGILWPCTEQPILSEKDACAPNLKSQQM